jgi:hypothetical protein
MEEQIFKVLTPPFWKLICKGKFKFFLWFCPSKGAWLLKLAVFKG